MRKYAFDFNFILFLGSEYSAMSIKAIQQFRSEFKMDKLSKIGHQDLWEKYCKDPLRAWTKEEMQDLNEYRNNVYRGDYEVVVLKEVKRKENGNTLANQYIDIVTEMRFGKVERRHIEFIKKHSAKKEDLSLDPKWINRFVLMGYHFYKESHSDRTTVDSMNARGLVEFHHNTGEPIMQVEAIHNPSQLAENLKKVPAKEFENLPAILSFCKGSRVMRLQNDNPSLNLYNSAICEFVGPLYLRSQYEIELNTEQLKGIHNLTIDKQIDISGGDVIPKNSKIITINGENATSDLLNGVVEDTVKIIYEEPSEPPALPDYMVIKVDGYSDLGGPPFFPGQHMRDYVAVPREKRNRQRNNKKARKQMKQSRTSFRLEGGDSESGFKAQGATHERDEVRVKGFFSRGGLWLVVVSRTGSIEHIYFPEGEMPNYLDVRLVIDVKIIGLFLRSRILVNILSTLCIRNCTAFVL